MRARHGWLSRHRRALVPSVWFLSFIFSNGLRAEPPKPAPPPPTIQIFDAATYSPTLPLPAGFVPANLLDHEGQRWVCKTATFDRGSCSQGAPGLFAAWSRERSLETRGAVRVEVRVLSPRPARLDREWAQAAWVATHGDSQLAEADLRVWSQKAGRVAESDVQWGQREETPAWGVSRYEERAGFVLYVHVQVDGRPKPAVRAELRQAFIDGPLGVRGAGGSGSDPATAKPSISAKAAAASPAPACAPPPPVAGFVSCEAVELTGAAPCEAICRRPRPLGQPDPCCEGPTEIAILSGSRTLLRIPACAQVPLQCANTHGHGRMDARLRILPGTPPEVLVVEGGCEARALMHGYVPPGVAAWTGCRHTRYHWNGQTFESR